MEVAKQIVELNENNDLLQKLFMKIFDKDFEITKQLYEKLESSDLINERIFNNYVWSAAHFEQKEVYDSLIESKRHEIDLQVYFKCMLSHFEGVDSPQKPFADNVISFQSQP